MPARWRRRDHSRVRRGVPSRRHQNARKQGLISWHDDSLHAARLALRGKFLCAGGLEVSALPPSGLANDGARRTHVLAPCRRHFALHGSTGSPQIRQHSTTAPRLALANPGAVRSHDSSRAIPSAASLLTRRFAERRRASGASSDAPAAVAGTTIHASAGAPPKPIVRSAATVQIAIHQTFVADIAHTTQLPYSGPIHASTGLSCPEAPKSHLSERSQRPTATQIP